MGRTLEQRTISVSLSRHNSEQDKEDDAAFDELLERIADLCREYPKIYAELW
jgi:hypothetical protein